MEKELNKIHIMLGKKTFVYISLFGKEHYKDVLGEIVFKLGSFKVILRLNSSVLDSRFVLPSEDLESFIAKNNFSNTQKIMLESLNLESRANNFEIWINNE